MKARRSIKQKLKFKIPSIRLAVVHNGKSSGVAIKSPLDAASLLEPLHYFSEEHFVSLHLNAKNEVIGMHEVSHGSLSMSIVHPREVFKAAMVTNSHALLVCHNHPSGAKLSPSKEDMETTSQLLAAGRLLGILVLDHIIVGPNQQAYSIRENHPELWQAHLEPALS